MGIYVFKKDQLVKLLKETYIQSNDFGGEIIPAAAADHKVVAYLFNDYWEDIGTIKSFFEANLALAQHVGIFFCFLLLNPNKKRRRILQLHLFHMAVSDLLRHLNKEHSNSNTVHQKLQHL